MLNLTHKEIKEMQIRVSLFTHQTDKDKEVRHGSVGRGLGNK